MTGGGGLARKSMGGGGLWFYAASASAPMTALAGGVVATYAATGVVGVPLAFLLLTGALYVLTVGYVAMARFVENAATFYALLAQGLSRAAGVAGGAVALLAYSAIEISLFGLIGATLAGDLGGAWWIWTGAVWIGIAVCGALRVDISGTLLSVLLVAEIAVIVVFDVAAFAHPAGGHISTTPLQPGHLFVNGVGGVLALSVAAFLGYESAPAYVEEARTERSAGRATLGALLILGPFYAISSWALGVAVGPAQVAAAARADADLPFTVMSQTLGVFGPLISGLGRLLLVTSIFAAMLSFHGTTARYTFALARARILPQRLARTGSGGSSRRDAPIAGSLLQSAVAAVVLTVFAIVRAGPVTIVFTWLAALAAVAVLVLLVASSAAAFQYFRRGGGPGHGVISAWSCTWAPGIAVLVGGGVVGVTVWNLDTLLGVPDGSARTYTIPAIVVATAVVGLVRAGVVARRDPGSYDRIGHERPHSLAMPDQRLSGVLR